MGLLLVEDDLIPGTFFPPASMSRSCFREKPCQELGFCPRLSLQVGPALNDIGKNRKLEAISNNAECISGATERRQFLDGDPRTSIAISTEPSPFRMRPISSSPGWPTGMAGHRAAMAGRRGSDP
jgi:hypothetical protein